MGAVDRSIQSRNRRLLLCRTCNLWPRLSYATNCRPCENERIKIWRREHTENVARYRQNNIVAIRERDAQAYRSNPERHKEAARASKYRRAYGITIEQYDKMFAMQDGVCALCGKPPGKTRLHVDHCHESKRVRGLLCAYCNQRRVGIARDSDAELFLWLVEYLAFDFDGRTL